MFFLFNKRKKGQSTLEYAIIIAVVVAALIAMQVYIKRGLQGRLRQSTDDIGEQFSPGYTTGTTTTSISSTSSETVVGGEKPVTITKTEQSQNRNTSETTLEFDKEYWK